MRSGKLRKLNRRSRPKAGLGEQRQAPPAQPQERQFAEQIVETVREPLLVLDAKLRVLSANPAFYRTFQVDPQETEGRLIYDLGGRQWDIPKLRHLLEDILPEHTTFEDFEVDHEFPDIGEKSMLLNARRLDGVDMILLAIEDVTERKRTEELLKQERNHLEDMVEERTSDLAAAMVDLEEVNAELEGYAHSVSHDLRGSMAIIEGGSLSLQNLLSIPESERSRSDVDEVAGIINEGVERGIRFIGDLLFLAAAGQAPLEVSDVDVGEVVERILEETSEKAKDKDVEVKVDDVPGEVRASPTHIYQLFLNLISNAIEHNDNQNPLVEVKYLGLDEAGGHRYLVRDNGPGIPPADLDKIFIPFFKGKTGRTGVGLATVEKVINTYSGGIKAYNDNGACFEFVIRDYDPDA